MTNDELIKELENDLRLLEKEIEPIEEAIGELQQRIIELKSPFKLGDIIWWEVGSGKIGKGRVVEILNWCCGDPMWKVHRIRKDGSYGGTCKVRDYMKPVAAPTEK